jgi:hypothetical protein
MSYEHCRTQSISHSPDSRYDTENELARWRWGGGIIMTFLSDDFFGKQKGNTGQNKKEYITGS